MNVSTLTAIRPKGPLDPIETVSIDGSEAIAEPDVDRFWLYVSSALGTAAFVLLVLGVPISYAYGLRWGAAVGVMGALWMGPGFGIMIAGARLAAIDDRRAAAAAFPMQFVQDTTHDV